MGRTFYNIKSNGAKHEGESGPEKNPSSGDPPLTLSGRTGPSLNSYLLTILIYSQILLLLLESAVAVIQSYVFAVLSTLFASEVN